MEWGSERSRRAAFAFYRRNYSWAELEDLLQEAAIAEWHAEQTWDPTRKGIKEKHVALAIKRALIDYARRYGPVIRSGNRRYDSGAYSFDPDIHDRGYSIDYDEAVDAKMRLQNLSETTKRTLVLRMAGWTIKEIAEVERVTESAICQRLDFRFRKEKRKSLHSQPSGTQARKQEKLLEFHSKLSKRIEGKFSGDLVPGTSLMR